ncbi:MAG: Crp/Fnr family transcriptional regulator [Clostridia bacterium]|nr:Crp/Fnr family transcriptional regulator [Clostridia bacterium]
MKIKQFLTEHLKITDETFINELASVMTVKTFKSGEEVFSQGRKITHMAFILKGVFRGYYIDSKGKEITDCFQMVYGDPLMPMFSFDEEVLLTMEAIVDSEVLWIDVNDMLALLKKRDQSMSIYTYILQGTTKRNNEFKSKLLHKNSTERYKWFLENYPGLIDKVKHSQVASLLGMTPVTLSRVRNSMRDTKSVADIKI